MSHCVTSVVLPHTLSVFKCYLLASGRLFEYNQVLQAIFQPSVTQSTLTLYSYGLYA